MFIRKILLPITLAFSLLSAYVFVPTIPLREEDYFEFMQKMYHPKKYREIYKWEVMFYHIRLNLFFDKIEYNTVFYSNLPDDGIVDNFFNIYELGYYHLTSQEYFKYVFKYGKTLRLTPLMSQYLYNNDIYSEKNKQLFCSYYNSHDRKLTGINKEEYQIILSKMGGCDE